MKKNRLQLDHLDQKMGRFKAVDNLTIPEIGWIKTIRMTFGMSLEQLGNKMGINKTSVKRMETRESNGSITIKTMKEAARAMDMKLVYGLIPVDGSLNQLIERKASKLAKEIVMRTSGTMKLEDQENSPIRIEKAIAERTKEIMEEMPKILWD